MDKKIYVGNSTDIYSSTPYAQVVVFPYASHNTKKLSLGDSASLATKEPIFIISDILSLNISKSKGNPTGNLALTLSGGDINYEEAIHPGDWIMAHIRRGQIVDELSTDINSGLKFLGVISEVYREQTTHNDGSTSVRYIVSANDWAYPFNTNVYFNPATLNDSQKAGELAGLIWTLNGVININKVTTANTTVESHIATILNNFLGGDPKQDSLKLADGRPVTQTPNRAFLIPFDVTKLFKPKQYKSTAEKPSSITNIMQRFVGLQQYGNNILPTFSGLLGNRVFYVALGSMFTVWSLLKSFSHEILNEMYTELLPDEKNSTKLVPTLVVRQIPFTTNEFAASFPATKFDSIPRVILPDSMIISKRIGRSLNTLVNYMQLMGQSSTSQEGGQVLQALAQNERSDLVAISRYGLKPMVKTDDFDDPAINTSTDYQSPKWLNFLDDWWSQLHHHFNGTITCNGIAEHIAVGYNLQVEDKLFHIEDYMHTYSVSPSGNHTFRTTLGVSMGRTIGKNGSFISLDTNTTDAQNQSIIKRDDRGLTDEEDRPNFRKGRE